MAFDHLTLVSPIIVCSIELGKQANRVVSSAAVIIYHVHRLLVVCWYPPHVKFLPHPDLKIRTPAPALPGPPPQFLFLKMCIKMQ